MRSLLVFLLLFSALFAQVDETDLTVGLEEERNETKVIQKVLYLDYADIPERVFKGQIFPLTLKVLSTVGQIEELVYTFSTLRGLDLLSKEPERIIKGRYTYDTFYFVAKSQWLQTPNIRASLHLDDDFESNLATLSGKRLDVITLNPASNFANVIANDFNITGHKTTSYDQQSNILVFSAQASQAALDVFHLNSVIKQGLESIDVRSRISEMTYYAVIPKRVDNMVFTYFQLASEKFIEVSIPIIVDDDMVSTQSDLKPTEFRHKLLKITIAGGIALVGLILLLLHKKLYYLVFIIIPGIYIAYAAVPISHACIMENSPIYLLPMTNGTVFETTTYRQTLEVEGEIKGYTKVKLENNKIGWIKNEDLCTP